MNNAIFIEFHNILHYTRKVHVMIRKSSQLKLNI